MSSDSKLDVQKLINFFNAGNYNKVLELSKNIIKKNPNSDFVYNIAGMCHQKFNDFENAEIFFMRTLDINKKNVNALTNLANNFKYKINFKKAKELYLKALEIKPKHLPALLNYGNLEFQLNQTQNALKLLLEALEINKDTIPVHLNLAIIYQSIGEFDKAINHLKKIDELDSTFTRSDKMMSLLINYKDKDKDNHLDKMIEKLKNLNLSDDQKIYLYFGIAKALEDKKEYKNSFEYIKLGNNLKHKNSKYKIQNDVAKIQSIKSFFKKYNFEKNHIKQNKYQPIFILGMPRSGTSLVEQIISSHKNVLGLGELNFFNNLSNSEIFFKNKDSFDLEKSVKHINQNYINIIESYKIEKKIFTDKTLLNYNWIGLIKLCFPNAKVINCLRNPKDNCISIYKNLFDHEGDWCYSEDDLVQYYKLYLEIISFWKEKIPNFIYEIQYENLIIESNTEIKNLINFCDLEWDEGCLNFYNNKNSIKTLSVKQARNKIYHTSINSFENFKKYSKDLFKNL